MINKRVLVTFDIDNTLIKCTRNPSIQFHRQAFSHAFNQIFGLNNVNIDIIPRHAHTDPLILVNTLVHHGFSSHLAFAKLPQLKEKMIEYAEAFAGNTADGLKLLPGVSSLLKALSSKGVNVIIGLVTGDLEEIAWMKMEGMGIRRHFSVPNFGGFGSDSIEHGELMKVAVEKAKRVYPEGFYFHVHVGDTPDDIRAADDGGALAVAVCTGEFAVEELRQVNNGSAVVLPDLTDAQGFMNLLGV